MKSIGAEIMLNLPEIKKKMPKAPYQKPEAVRELERFSNAEARRKHPAINPRHLAPRLYRDDSANDLTRCIVDYIRLRGGFSSRINATGIWRAHLNRYTPTSQKKGIPDVIGTYNGKSLFVEVKIGLDKMSDHQERIRDEQTASGGLYYVAHNFTDFKIFLDSL